VIWDIFLLFSLSKAATTTALNWSELALLIFGIVLGAGLVGEYRTLEPHTRSMKFFEMLAISDVLGELIADGGIFLFSSNLQTIATPKSRASPTIPPHRENKQQNQGWPASNQRLPLHGEAFQKHNNP
jgi:hypothetical protein